MINILMKAFSLIALVTLFIISFSGCEKSKEADNTNTTIETTVVETTVIETGEATTMNGDISETTSYDALKKTFNKFEELFKDNQDVFKQAAELMVSQEVDTSVIYDFDRDSIAYVVVFDNGMGHRTDVEDVFSQSQQDLMLNCLRIMASIAPEDSRSISIKRDTGRTFFPLGVDFMFSSELNIDYGLIFTEYPFSSYESKIDDNWYTYMYGLV